MKVSQFYLSATHKSSGKTMTSIGLCASFSLLNKQVQPFKKGLDYIDPIWHKLASGNASYNLDFYTMDKQEILNSYQTHSQNMDVCLVEGNKGLFDGLNPTGGDSNADMASLLNLPVVLVVDATGITRGIAPLLQGYQQFDNTNIVGIILNKVAGSRHQSKLIQAVEHYTDMAIFGAISRDNKLFVQERYLGLKPANEYTYAKTQINNIANRIKDEVDLNNLLTINANKKVSTHKLVTPNIKTKVTNNMRIAVAKDKAFGFYYEDDLAEFVKQGVELVYFDTLKDKHLPKADGLLIGGGFPEIYAQELSKNTILLNDVKQKIQSGLPTYAECGGLMYLSRCLITKKGSFAMVGIIEADTQMYNTPIGRGYVQLQKNDQDLWQTGTNTIINAHEFHYSKLINIAPNTKYAYTVVRGTGINNNDGIIKYNLLASYTHLKNSKQYSWVKYFVAFIQNKQANKI